MTPSDEEKKSVVFSPEELAAISYSQNEEAIKYMNGVWIDYTSALRRAFKAGCAYARADEREKIWMELNKKLNDCTVIDFIKEAEKIVEEAKAK